MTVSSLWKVLDRSGCGQPVGVKELLDHHQLKKKTTPWNYNQEIAKQRRTCNSPTLAVDLSIWICEALTSSAMQQNHVSDPALHLVYSRTLKLLNLGIKLVIVVEGKRRIRRTVSSEGDDSGEDKFRKRRSGAKFWTACQRCEAMLQALGVPVVRAKTEGEALCALLNQKGIVDGVISNDGDCLLFGAKVLYTKFSIENLEQSKVIRYDANNISACLDDDDADQYDETGDGEKPIDGAEIVKLSRDDLIAFAILTGSDLAGDGLDKVGCRKAIRFIRKCRIDNPLKLDESPAMTELISWGKAAARSSGTMAVHNTEQGEKIQTCGCCGHPGDKRSHKKNGCTMCGTDPGEPCFQLSPGGRFRKTLRSKAMELQPRFDPASTIRLYHEPNDNQLPLALVGKKAETLEMQFPRLDCLLQTKSIVRGGNLEESRQFIQKSLSTYLAKMELSRQSQDQPGGTTKIPKNENRPTPLRVTKLLVRAGKPACEIQWIVKATVTDAGGNPVGQLEFFTVEEESMIRKCYPTLLEKYTREGPKMDDQGDTEQEKRQAFLASMFTEGDCGTGGIDLNSTKKLAMASRKGFFDEPFSAKTKPMNTKRSSDLQNLLIDVQKQFRKKRAVRVANETSGGKRERRVSANGSQKPSNCSLGATSCGDDIAIMLYADRHRDGQNRDDDSTIESTEGVSDRICGFAGQLGPTDYSNCILSPGHLHFLKGYATCEKKNGERKSTEGFDEAPIKVIEFKREQDTCYLKRVESNPSNLEDLNGPESKIAAMTGFAADREVLSEPKQFPERFVKPTLWLRDDIELDGGFKQNEDAKQSCANQPIEDDFRGNCAYQDCDDFHSRNRPSIETTHQHSLDYEYGKPYQTTYWRSPMMKRRKDGIQQMDDHVIDNHENFGYNSNRDFSCERRRKATEVSAFGCRNSTGNFEERSDINSIHECRSIVPPSTSYLHTSHTCSVEPRPSRRSPTSSRRCDPHWNRNRRNRCDYEERDDIILRNTVRTEDGTFQSINWSADPIFSSYHTSEEQKEHNTQNEIRDHRNRSSQGQNEKRLSSDTHRSFEECSSNYNFSNASCWVEHVDPGNEFHTKNSYNSQSVRPASHSTLRRRETSADLFVSRPLQEDSLTSIVRERVEKRMQLASRGAVIDKLLQQPLFGNEETLF